MNHGSTAVGLAAKKKGRKKKTILAHLSVLSSAKFILCKRTSFPLAKLFFFFFARTNFEALAKSKMVSVSAHFYASLRSTMYTEKERINLGNYASNVLLPSLISWTAEASLATACL